MDFCRPVGSCLVAALVSLWTAGSLAAAETSVKHSLKSQHRQGEMTRVDVAVQVGGDLKLVVEKQDKSLPMSVVANLKYDERLLALDPAGLPRRSARCYYDTQAAIKVDQGGEKPSLDPARRLIVAERREKAASLLYCPTAHLLREELDLIDVPAGSLLVDELLPAEPVAFGDTWKLSDDTLARLLCLDAVSWGDVTSVLGEIKDGIAEIAAAGSVSGAVGGVSTEIELKAKYRFDLAQHRIIFVALLIKEKRSVGHVGPGLDTVAKVLVSITPISSSQYLTDDLLATIPATDSPQLATLEYAAASGQFRFQHDRRWYLTSDDAKLTILRLLDRGELVAQCNVSLLAGEKKTPVTLAEFQQDVQKSLGKNFGQFTSASQATSEAGYSVLRVVARGTVSQLPIEWIYYLVQDGQGKRVSLAFTYEQELADRFAQADRTLVAQLRLTAPPVPTAAVPKTQK